MSRDPIEKSLGAIVIAAIILAVVGSFLVVVVL